LVILDSSTNATFYDLYTTGMLQDEIAVKLVFSNTNSNIFYVMSNKTIYKKFVTNPVQNIGSFSFTQGITGNNSQLAGNLLYDMDTYDSQNNYDDLMVFGYGQFLNYNEQTIFNSTIK